MCQRSLLNMEAIRGAQPLVGWALYRDVGDKIRMPVRLRGGHGNLA